MRSSQKTMDEIFKEVGYAVTNLFKYISTVYRCTVSALYHLYHYTDTNIVILKKSQYYYWKCTC